VVCTQKGKKKNKKKKQVEKRNKERKKGRKLRKLQRRTPGLNEQRKAKGKKKKCSDNATSRRPKDGTPDERFDEQRVGLCRLQLVIASLHACPAHHA
jgi:hypothetical protein